MALSRILLSGPLMRFGGKRRTRGCRLAVRVLQMCA